MKLSGFEKDVLREIGNMGASYSANSLSEIMNKKVEIRVPDFDVLPLEEFPNVVGGGEEIVAGILVKFNGDISGYLMLFYQLKYALNLADLLLGKELGTTKELDEMDISAIQEVGNILGSHFVNTFSDFLGFKIYVSPPNIIVNSDFNEILKIFESEDIKLLLMNTSFIESNNNKVNGNLIVLSNAKTLNQIFDAISEKI